MNPADGVTVIVPTRNEAANLPELVRRLQTSLVGHGLQRVLFVDDSDDATPQLARDLGRAARLPVDVLHRPPAERSGGLSGAVVTGIRRAGTPWVVVMDGDLQHPPELIPDLVRAAATPEVAADVVVASRYRGGGSARGLSSGRRRLISGAAVAAAKLVFPRRLRGCSDPMAGFFLVRRDRLAPSGLRPQGFKILLELLVRHELVVTEVPLQFGRRLHGASKASAAQGWALLGQLLRLRADAWRGALARWRGARSAAPTLTARRRLLRFGAVGAANVVVDVAAFNALLAASGEPVAAKALSGCIAIASSYAMNRRWTWADREPGFVRSQLPAFVAVSLVGVAITEALLAVSHYVLGWRGVLADNAVANGLGLAVAMAWRFYAYDRWVFSRGRGAEVTEPVPGRLPG